MFIQSISEQKVFIVQDGEADLFTIRTDSRFRVREESATQWLISLDGQPINEMWVNKSEFQIVSPALNRHSLN